MPFQWKMFDLATFAMFAMKTICLVDMFPVSLQIPISKSLPVAKVNFTGRISTFISKAEDKDLPWQFLK
jgi:hypothetical protein